MKNDVVTYPPPLSTSTPIQTRGKAKENRNRKAATNIVQPPEINITRLDTDYDAITVDAETETMSDSFTQILFFRHLRRAGVTDDILEKDE